MLNRRDYFASPHPTKNIGWPSFFFLSRTCKPKAPHETSHACRALKQKNLISSSSSIHCRSTLIFIVPLLFSYCSSSNANTVFPMEMGALRTSDRRMEIYFGSYKSVFIPFFEAIDAKAVISLWRMRKTLWQDTLAHYYDVAQKGSMQGALWSLGG